MATLFVKINILFGGLLLAQLAAANIKPISPLPNSLVEISKSDAKENRLPPINIKLDFGDSPVSAAKFTGSNTYLRLAGHDATPFAMGMQIDATTKAVDTDSDFQDFVKENYDGARDVVLGEMETLNFKGKTRKMMALQQGESSSRMTTCVIAYAPKFQSDNNLIVSFSVPPQEKITCSAVIGTGAFNRIIETLLITQ